MFLLFINDLPLQLKGSETTLYADDTTVTVRSKKLSSIKQLETVTRIADDWCNKNKLTINTSKCKILNLGKTNTNDTFDLKDESLDIVSEFKYLGVWIDKSLTFETHVCTVLKKLTRFNGVMYKARSCFSSSTLLQFYKTYAKPLISYGLLVYGNSSRTLLNKVFVMQKRIIRTIFLKRKFEQVGNIFEKFKIKSVLTCFLTNC